MHELENANPEIIRARLNNGQFDSFQKPFVVSGLERKDRETENLHRAEELRLGKEANKVAKQALEISLNANSLAEKANSNSFTNNIVALIALFVSVCALIISIKN